MATKAFWPTLIATTLFVTGCSTLPSGATQTENQRSNNQPELTELDSSSTADQSKAPVTTRAQKESSETKTTQPSSAKPVQDPGVDVSSNDIVIEPDAEQVVIRLQQTALQFQSEGKWQEAENVLQRALRIDVQKVDIYHQLATVRMGQQRFAEAEQIALKGLTYTDKSPKFKSSLWEVIAQCRSAQGDIKGANEARDEMLKWMVD
jgi:predicted Zn-dependent protease